MGKIRTARKLTHSQAMAVRRAQSERSTRQHRNSYGDQAQKGGRVPPPITLPAWAEKIVREMKDEERAK